MSHPATEPLRRAVHELATGSGRLRERLQAAERHLREVSRADMLSPAERHLDLRIGAALVEGGLEDLGDVADSIAHLDESRSAEIAADVLRLYEVVLGVQDDDGYGNSAHR
jgi:hypothetical protein